MPDFKKEFNSRPLLADGAMGTLLAEFDIPEDLNKSLQSLKNFAIVKKIHKQYLQAGADIITTNTFDANTIKLREHKELLPEILKSAVRAALEARSELKSKAFIAGSIGPLGALLRPYGILSFQDMIEMFREITSILIESGVDLIILETFSSILELKAGISAVRKADSSLPLIASMTFNSDGLSRMGDELEKSLIEIQLAGADIAGINCFLGPRDSFELAKNFLKKNCLLLSVMPNAGIPAQVNNRTYYLSNPDYFKEYTKSFLRIGTSIIGSCCGTTPLHTARMSEAFREKNLTKISLERETQSFFKKENVIKKAIDSSFLLTVEVSPPKFVNFQKALKLVKELKKIGVKAVNITENPLAKIRMSPAAFAKIIIDETEVEPILHFTLRDRNLLAIQSDLLGAYALGIRNILALKGDPSIMGDFPRATSVYDITTTELIEIIKRFNSGIDINQKKLHQKTDFLVAAAANPNSSDLNVELDRLKAKIDAGADFIITQPIFDSDSFQHFYEKYSRAISKPLICGIMELKDFKYAHFLANEVPGFKIPFSILNNLERRFQSGIEIALEIAQKLRPFSQGFYLVSSSNNIECYRFLINQLNNI